MATEVLELQIRATGTAAAKSQIDGIASSAKIAAETMQLLRGALVLVGAFRIGQGFVEFADRLDDIQDNIARVTESAQEQQAVLNNVARTAQETASRIDDVNDIYVKVARSIADGTRTQQDALDVTRALTAAYKLSGTSATEAKSTTDQLTVSFAQGALQGRALQALLKNAPEAAAIVAKEFGIAAGQLKQFAANNPGILSTERAIKALAAAAPELAAQAKLAADNTTDGFQRIENAAVVFFGNLVQKIGASKAANEFLTTLSENLDKVTVAVLGVATAFTLSTLFANFIPILAGVSGGLLVMASRLTVVIPLVTGLASVIEFLTAIILANPIVAGVAAIAFAGLLVYLSATGQSFSDLIPTMQTVNNVANVIIASFITLGSVVYNTVANLPQIFGEFGIAAANAFISAIEAIVKAVANVVASTIDTITVGLTDLQGRVSKIDFGRIANPFAGTTQSIVNDATKTFNDVYNSNPVQKLINFGKEAYDKATGYFKQFTIQQPAAVNTVLTPKAATGGDFLDKDGKGAADKIQRLKDQIEGAIGKFDPYIRGIAEIDKFHTLLGKNAEVTRQILAKLGITEEEVNKRMIRDIIGVGNEVTDMQGKIKLLNEAFERGDVSATEYAKAMRDIAGAATGVVESISPLIAAQNKLAADMLAVANAQQAGINLGLTDAEIKRRLLREQVGVGNAATDLAEKTKLLNDAFAAGAVSTKEYDDQLRKLQETFLSTQTDSVSGFQLGILKVQDEFLNTSKDAAATVSNLFSGLQGELENFFQNGKFNFSKLVDGILNDLTKLAIKGAITGPLAKLLGGGGYDGSTGAETDPFGGLFAALTGGLSKGGDDAAKSIGDAFAGPGDDTAKGISEAFTKDGQGFLGGLGGIIQQLAQSVFGGGSSGGGLGGLFGGGGGGGGIGDFIGGLFGGGGDGGLGGWDGTIPGFDSGGSLMVGGESGRDKNFMGLRVSRGERVDILTPEQQIRQRQKNNGNGHAVIQNFHINTPDADSFRRSQGQIGVMAAQGLQRAQARNG